MNEEVNKDTNILGNKEWFRVKDISEMLSMAESTVWKMVRNKNFPEPQKITPRMTIWTRQSVMNWVESKSSDGAARNDDNQN